MAVAPKANELIITEWQKLKEVADAVNLLPNKDYVDAGDLNSINVAKEYVDNHATQTDQLGIRKYAGIVPPSNANFGDFVVEEGDTYFQFFNADAANRDLIDWTYDGTNWTNTGAWDSTGIIVGSFFVITYFLQKWDGSDIVNDKMGGSLTWVASDDKTYNYFYQQISGGSTGFLPDFITINLNSRNELEIVPAVMTRIDNLETAVADLQQAVAGFDTWLTNFNGGE